MNDEGRKEREENTLDRVLCRRKSGRGSRGRSSRFRFWEEPAPCMRCFTRFCLYRNASGITYPFFVAGTLFYFSFCTKKFRVLSGNSGSGRKDALDGLYAGVLLLLGISVCLTADGKIHLMTKTGIFLLTVVLVMRQFYRTKEWDFFTWLCRICRSLAETLSCLDTPFRDGFGWLGERDRKKKGGRFQAAAIGLLAAIPFLIVILALLISADAVFSDLLERAAEGMNLWNTGGMIALTALIFVLSYSYMRGLTADLTNAPAPGNGKEKKKYQPVSALAFTSVTALVYLFFCGIQVAYLVLGKDAAAGWPDLGTIRPTGIFPAFVRLPDQSGAGAGLSGGLRREQGAQGRADSHLPDDLYHDRVQRLPDVALHPELSPHLPAAVRPLGAGGHRAGVRGSHRVHLLEGIPPVRLLYRDSRRPVSSARFRQAGLLDRPV